MHNLHVFVYMGIGRHTSVHTGKELKKQAFRALENRDQMVTGIVQ